MNGELYFIRHGATAGNLEKRYIGRTDELLCSEGISEVKKLNLPDCDLLISSPMKRCLQTAQLLYPDKKIRICEDFKECDFGLFEMHNYQELTGNQLYQNWIDSGGKIAFPEGESPEAFKQRVICAFSELWKDCISQRVVFVVHGGTIMTIMEKYAVPAQDYYTWHVSNAHGYLTRFDGQKLSVIQKL